MAADFPYVYPYSRGEARRLNETGRYDDSFRLNVDCARAIEQAIREHFNDADESLSEGCAQSALEQFGFKRVTFVLANSLQELQKSVSCKHLVSDETYRWGRRTFVPEDGEYNQRDGNAGQRVGSLRDRRPDGQQGAARSDVQAGQ